MAGETRLVLDYETGNFSNFSGVEEGSSSQAIIDTSPTRAGWGDYTCKFSNIPGVYWYGNGSMRALAARYDTDETVSQEYFWAGSMYFPSGGELLDGSQLLWELHHGAELYNLAGLGVAPHALYASGGNLYARLEAGFGTIGSGWGTYYPAELIGSIVYDQWLDFIINIAFSQTNGHIAYYYDDTGNATFGAPAVALSGLPTMPWTTGIENVSLYTETGIYNNSGTNAVQSSTEAYYSTGWRRDTSYAQATGEWGGQGSGSSSQPVPPVLPPGPVGLPGQGPTNFPGGTPPASELSAEPESLIRFPCGTQWRFIVTNLEGETLTLLDRLASDRTVTPHLNEALEVSCTVPSDNIAINGLDPDGFPLVAEGVRQLYCFRRESDSSPYWTIRASTLILQVDDAAPSEDARSRISAWDPWVYLMSTPVLQGDGTLIGVDGLTFADTATADEIIYEILSTAILWSSITAPVAAQSCFLDINSGTYETCANFSPGWNIAQGTSVGQALQDLAATGYCDIVLSPIYDPVNRPGILCEVNVYAQDSVRLGAGDYRYGAKFAWDRPGRSMTGVDNLYDGTGRANTIQFYNGPGGPPVTRYSDGPSIARYGDYWAQTWFPSHTKAVAVKAIAAEQLALRKNFRETLTVNPAPERSPQPFIDYYLGDAVQVYVSNRMRQALSGWQRIYGIPISIDDNGVETVRELLVGPVGAPPPPDLASGVPKGIASGNVPITTSLVTRTNRQGGVGAN